MADSQRPWLLSSSPFNLVNSPFSQLTPRSHTVAPPHMHTCTHAPLPLRPLVLPIVAPPFAPRLTNAARVASRSCLSRPSRYCSPAPPTPSIAPPKPPQLTHKLSQGGLQQLLVAPLNVLTLAVLNALLGGDLCRGGQIEGPEQVRTRGITARMEVQNAVVRGGSKCSGT